MNINKKKYSNILLLLLIAIVGTLYSYQKKKPISHKDLINIIGTLKQEPYHGTVGDIPEPYIRILINEDRRKFNLIYCSYSSSLKDNIINSEPGDSVLLSVKKNDSNKKTLTIYRMSISGKEYLSLSSHNKCYTTKWKMILPFIYLFTSILFIMLFIDLKKYLSTRNK